jgi:putative membrane protein
MFRKPDITVLTAAATIALLAAAPAKSQENGPPLNDAQIAHVAVTANAIDIEMGEIARTRGSDERVREFAERMITDHTAVNEQAAALASRLGVTPAANAISGSLRDGAEAAKRTLRAASGADFDRAYMAHEVDYHRSVLQALDQTLIPSTTNGELRALLEQARGAIAAHLAHAERLHASLGSKP